jgi:hypothetical protein
VNVNSAGLSSLMARIVETTFPDEVDAFSVGGNALVEEALQRGGSPHPKGRGGEFEFGPEATAALGFVSALGAAVLALKAMYEAIVEKGGDEKVRLELKEKWAGLLRERGLTESEARAISTRFAGDLAELVVRKK